MPPSPLAQGERLQCVSYAPFRDQQTPLDFNTRIDAAQIDDDLSRLAKLTDCIRIYSFDVGLDQVPAIAERHGLKVLLGLWVSNRRDRTEWQIKTGVALAKRFPDTFTAGQLGRFKDDDGNDSRLVPLAFAQVLIADLTQKLRRRVGAAHEVTAAA